ncbi:MAG: hypothetical protein SAL07_25850 [Oscillatoria sp. PMC 1051.18]|nr:hypothetical protein [Oscillatoria sp. PMC 1050.18]MEC5033333.1 hypothetical protein [Oscillatoria sp. PMC 1051.18]
MTTFFKLVNPNAEFPIIYGLPDTAFRDVVKFKPQVRLYFRGYTDRQTTDEIAKKLEGQVSFRLMDENYSTSAINSLALKVKNKFRNFFYQRGDALYTYTDQRRGYHFQLYVGGEIAAKKVIEAVNDVAANTTLDWTLLKNHSRNQDLPKIKGKLTVMGETRTIKNVTRSGRVYFAYAELFIPDWGEPITLVDGTGTRPRAIEVF